MVYNLTQSIGALEPFLTVFKCFPYLVQCKHYFPSRTYQTYVFYALSDMLDMFTHAEESIHLPRHCAGYMRQFHLLQNNNL